MRRRLLASFLALTILALLLFGIPRAFIVAERTRDAEERDITRIAETALTLVEGERLAGRSVPAEPLARLLGPEDALQLHDPVRQDVVEVGRPLEATTGIVVTLAGETASITIARSDAAVRLRVLEALTSIALVGAAVIVVAVVLAFLLSRQMAQPFVALARSAERLGHGDFELDLPDTRLAEATAIREALAGGAARLQDTMRREREFASNASHQLRTPLAALRLRLEDLMLWPEVPEAARGELQAGLADVDRLADTVTGMLELSRRGVYGAMDRVDLAERARDAAARWDDQARDRGRTVRLGQLDPATAHAAAGAIDQVLDVLVHNALEHGDGAITLETLAEPEHVRLRVRDQGAGVTAAQRSAIFRRHHRGEASAGEGIGLPLAQDVAHSLGGTLTVGSDPPTTFDLILPGA